MPTINHDVLRKFVYDMYIGAGGVEEDARIVSNHVVDSNLMGHDSHGVINAPNYAGGMGGGPSTDKMKIVRETPATAVINANGGLGMVIAQKAMEMAIEKAKTHTFGGVGLHRCGHAGRMGTYPHNRRKGGDDWACFPEWWWTIYAPLRRHIPTAPTQPNCHCGPTQKRRTVDA